MGSSKKKPGAPSGGGGAHSNLPPEVAAAKAELIDVEDKRSALVEELRLVEKQIYDLETRYLATANPAGTALKGYDGLLSSTGGAGGAGGGGGGGGGGAGSRRSAPVKAEERLFSRSSTTGQPPGSK